MSNNPDKLDRFKLETSFGIDTVTHTTYRTDLAAQERRTIVQTTWTDKKKLGSGGFGVVILQEAGNGGKLRAVKKIYTGTGTIDFSREVSVMVKVAHNTDFVFLAMEYIEHGDLNQYLNDYGPCSPSNARAITKQLLDGLVTLHELKITHRDIKPQNVLVALPNPIWVKITDFGVSKRTKGTMLRTAIGSQGYLAPELIGLVPRRNYRTNDYSNAVDIWALGCLVHELLTGEIPFREIEYEDDGTTEFDLGSQEFLGQQTDSYALKLFCDGETEFPTDKMKQRGVGEVAIEFLKAMLLADPGSRADAKAALGYAWLVQDEEDGRINHDDPRVYANQQSTSTNPGPVTYSTNNSPLSSAAKTTTGKSQEIR
ncbi:hypothetical protein Q9L58_005902 [Maublancomyces gigas]|uniref:Protein kinase domain-containing protein n=1 Tax=Discina gigas TaxID=1032678 RepID=A0ABR3GGX8_9PEZI